MHINNTVNLYRHATAKTTRWYILFMTLYRVFAKWNHQVMKRGTLNYLQVINWVLSKKLDAYLHYMWYILMKSAVYHQFMVLFLYDAWMIRVSFSFLYFTLRMYFVYRMLYTISYLTQTKFIPFLICFVAC